MFRRSILRANLCALPEQVLAENIGNQAAQFFAAEAAGLGFPRRVVRAFCFTKGGTRKDFIGGLYRDEVHRIPFAAELFRFREGIEMQHVPYRGMPQALTDVIGGQIDCVFADPASAQGLVQDGKLRALAVTSSKRLESMPDLPTIGESGLPGFELAAWVGVYVRAKTPPEIVAKLNDLVTAFVNSSAARNYLATIGATRSGKGKSAGWASPATR